MEHEALINGVEFAIDYNLSVENSVYKRYLEVTNGGGQEDGAD